MSWQETLLDAAYKGVRFDVTGDNLDGGHALNEHAYPYVAGSDIEDMGADGLSIRLTALLWGDDYERRLQTLLNVLRERGAGELVHPVYGSVPDCVVESYSVSHDPDRPDSCEVTMTFRPATAAAPFFDRELPEALADGLDALAELAQFAGLQAFTEALARLDVVRGRVQALTRAVNHVLVTLAQQAGALWQGAVDLARSPRHFFDETRAVVGLLLARHDKDNGISGWQAVLRSTDSAVQTVPSLLATDEARLDTAATVAVTAAVALIAHCELAAEAADRLAVEAQSPQMTPAEVAQIASATRERLQRSLTVARGQALAAVLPEGQQAEMQRRLTAILAGNDSIEVYDDRWRPQADYLAATAALADALRTMAQQVQRQALAVIVLRPPLIRRRVEADGNLHLLAHRWYGDYRRAGELLRLNPQLRLPCFVLRGEVLYAYAR